MEIPPGAPVLVIKPPWMNMILDGDKTLEIRSTACRKPAGTDIFLAQSRTAVVSGVVKFVGVHGPLSEEQWEALREKHRVMGPRPYGRTYAWEVEQAQRFTHPVPYIVNRGAIVWRKFQSRPE